MKKKFISAILFGAFTLAATNTFVSCKDYDDDISNLQSQIDELSKKITEIQSQIQNGAILTDVTSTTNGVKLTLSTGVTYDITNGKDGTNGTNGTNGKDGSVVKIGDNGNWFIDDVDTGIAAKGTNGTNGTNGTDGAYYEPNEDGYFYKVEADGTKTKSIKWKTDDSSSSSTIYAVWAKRTLTLYNVPQSAGGTASDPIVISLDGNLTSLVFKPMLYFDGIETIEYPWLKDSVKVGDGEIATKSRATLHKGGSADPKDIKLYASTDANYAAHPDYYVPQNFEWTNYGPVKGVQYHINPANANVEEDDVDGYNVLEPTVIYTRANATALNITAPGKTEWGYQIFNAEDGILTAGLKVENPQLLDEYPTKETITGFSTSEQAGKANLNANTIAIQVKTDDPDQPLVTSDYALLIPSKMSGQGLYWVLAPDYAHAAPDLDGVAVNPIDANGNKTVNRAGDELCPFTNVKDHIWSNPKPALMDKDGAALEMYFNESDFDLTKYVGICLAKQNLTTGKMEQVKLPYGSEKAYGLEYEFNIVDYDIDGNQTGDSHYIKAVDGKVGHFRAVNVNAAGEEDPQSTTSIDREPLIQVLVKCKKWDSAKSAYVEKVVMDGYILIHISKTRLAEKDNVFIEYPEFDTYSFDLCNSHDWQTIWSEFNKYVLTDGLDDMTKVDFDKYYEPDGVAGSPAADGSIPYVMNLFTTPNTKGDTNKDSKQLGTLTVFVDEQGPTNHATDWVLSEDEMEELTHHQTLPVKVSRYYRYKAKDQGAPYPYVYIKQTIVLNRVANSEYTFGDKNQEHYWWSLDGKSTGDEGTIFDIQAPRDNQVIDGYDGIISNQLENNNLASIYSGTSTVGKIESDGKWTGLVQFKYYFVPGTITITDEYDGTQYEITAGNDDPTKITYYSNGNIASRPSISTTGAADKLYCLYVNSNDETHAYPSTEAALKTLLQECAINYYKGAFVNNALYGKEKGSSAAAVKIATLDQFTGDIELEKVTMTKKILNAQGYKNDPSKIVTQMYGKVGIIAKGKNCEYSSYVAEPFVTSFSRPINLENVASDVIDAKTNENYLYLSKLLQISDWRKIQMPDANGNNWWFWTYYKIKSIKVDCTPENVLVRRLDASGNNVDNTTGDGYVKLNTITSALHLYAYYAANSGGSVTTGQVATYNIWDNFNVTVDGMVIPRTGGIKSWDAQADNATFKADVDLNPSHYGYIYYQNNAGVVKEFYVKVPITISYEWGDLERVVTIHVAGTESAE